MGFVSNKTKQSQTKMKKIIFMKDCQIQHFTGYPGESMKLTIETVPEVLLYVHALCIDRNSLACKRQRVTRYFLQVF